MTRPTDYVFDGQSTRPYRPGDARNPLSVYGLSKAAGEDAAGPDALIVRTSWLYDSGGTNFVRTMLRLMAERDEIRVVADQIGAPTWARELSGVIWQLVQGGRSGVYHYADDGSASWYDLAVATYEEGLRLGLVDHEVSIVPIPTDAFPQQARRPAYSLLDSSATLAELGRTPIDWRANLQRMLKVERASR